MSPEAKALINRLLIIIVILGVGLGVSHLLLRTSVVNLATAPAYSGQVSQDLQPDPNTGQLLTVNKDFTLSPHTLDNGQWVVVSVQPSNNNFDGGVIVLQKQGGIYQTQLGLGSTFTQNQISALPGEVAAYVLTQAGVDEPTP